MLHKNALFMIAGHCGALHKHTLCTIHGPKGSPHNGERCTVVAFVKASGTWTVRLVDPAKKGAELQVPESALRVSFCLLPSLLGKEKFFVQCASQPLGEVGRDLVVQQHVKCDTPIFSEPPFLVAGSQVGSDEAMMENSVRRWHAFLALAHNASKDTADGRYTKAMSAFNLLSVGSHLPTELTSCAESIVAKHFAAASALPNAETRTSYLDKVIGVLGRFHSNQFRLDTLHNEPALATSGLYSFIGSHVNHSCNPSMSIVPKRLYESWYGISSSIEQSGGVLLAYAIRPLQPGESLTFNYGPPELATSWDVTTRRAFLQTRQGFFCLCDKCVKEGGSSPPPKVVTRDTKAARGVPMPDRPPSRGMTLEADTQLHESTRSTDTSGEHGAGHAQEAQQVVSELKVTRADASREPAVGAIVLGGIELSMAKAVRAAVAAAVLASMVLVLRRRFRYM